MSTCVSKSPYLSLLPPSLIDRASCIFLFQHSRLQAAEGAGCAVIGGSQRYTRICKKLERSEYDV